MFLERYGSWLLQIGAAAPRVVQHRLDQNGARQRPQRECLVERAHVPGVFGEPVDKLVRVVTRRSVMQLAEKLPGRIDGSL